MASVRQLVLLILLICVAGSQAAKKYKGPGWPPTQCHVKVQGSPGGAAFGNNLGCFIELNGIRVLTVPTFPPIGGYHIISVSRFCQIEQKAFFPLFFLPVVQTIMPSTAREIEGFMMSVPEGHLVVGMSCFETMNRPVMPNPVGSDAEDIDGLPPLMRALDMIGVYISELADVLITDLPLATQPDERDTLIFAGRKGFSQHACYYYRHESEADIVQHVDPTFYQLENTFNQYPGYFLCPDVENSPADSCFPYYPLDAETEVFNFGTPGSFAPRLHVYPSMQILCHGYIAAYYFVAHNIPSGTNVEYVFIDIWRNGTVIGTNKLKICGASLATDTLPKEYLHITLPNERVYAQAGDYISIHYEDYDGIPGSAQSLGYYNRHDPSDPFTSFTQVPGLCKPNSGHNEHNDIHAAWEINEIDESNWAGIQPLSSYTFPAIPPTIHPVAFRNREVAVQPVLVSLSTDAALMANPDAPAFSDLQNYDNTELDYFTVTPERNVLLFPDLEVIGAGSTGTLVGFEYVLIASVPRTFFVSFWSVTGPVGTPAFTHQHTWEVRTADSECRGNVCFFRICSNTAVTLDPSWFIGLAFRGDTTLDQVVGSSEIAPGLVDTTKLYRKQIGTTNSHVIPTNIAAASGDVSTFDDILLLQAAPGLRVMHSQFDPNTDSVTRTAVKDSLSCQDDGDCHHYDRLMVCSVTNICVCPAPYEFYKLHHACVESEDLIHSNNPNLVRSTWQSSSVDYMGGGAQEALSLTSQLYFDHVYSEMQCSHTDESLYHPWWVVDLQNLYYIHHVTIQAFDFWESDCYMRIRELATDDVFTYIDLAPGTWISLPPTYHEVQTIGPSAWLVGERNGCACGACSLSTAGEWTSLRIFSSFTYSVGASALTFDCAGKFDTFIIRRRSDGLCLTPTGMGGPDCVDRYFFYDDRLFHAPQEDLASSSCATVSPFNTDVNVTYGGGCNTFMREALIPNSEDFHIEVSDVLTTYTHFIHGNELSTVQADVFYKDYGYPRPSEPIQSDDVTVTQPLAEDCIVVRVAFSSPFSVRPCIKLFPDIPDRTGPDDVDVRVTYASRYRFDMEFCDTTGGPYTRTVHYRAGVPEMNGYAIGVAKDYNPAEQFKEGAFKLCAHVKQNINYKELDIECTTVQKGRYLAIYHPQDGLLDDNNSPSMRQHGFGLCNVKVWGAPAYYYDSWCSGSNNPDAYCRQGGDHHLRCDDDAGVDSTYLCVCEPGFRFFWHAWLCIPYGMQGWPCSQNEDCYPDFYMYCDAVSTCQCRDGYWYSDLTETCWAIGDHGDDCNDDMECQVNDPNLVCVSNKCECRQAYKWNDPAHHCALEGEHWKPCNPADSAACESDIHLHCEEDTPTVFICKCEAGYYWEPYLRICIAIGETDMNCPGDTDCGTDVHLECNAGKCQCIGGYVWNNVSEACQPDGMHGKTCTDDDSCQIHNQILFCDGVNTICECASGYRYDPVSLGCYDVIECLDDDLHDCDEDPTAECTNLPGTHICTCNDGYEWNAVSMACENINECDTDNGGCEHTCTDNDPLYTCGCEDGYSLDMNLHSCSDEDECTTDMCDDVNGWCHNTLGSYECGCNIGYELDLDGVTCNNIDECGLPEQGHCQHTCTDNDGSYTCSCDTGWELEDDVHTCKDTDECTLETDNCNDPNGFCENTVGSFVCGCNTGWELDGNGVTCNDINECMTNNGGCQQTCDDSDGSYTCDCVLGFSLNDNGHTCSNDNECADSDDNCDDTNGFCHDTEGSFECGCNSGYRLNTDGSTCDEIDECSDAEHYAGCDQICSNTPAGSYTCDCNAGYTLNAADSHSCDDDDECTAGTDNCDDTNGWCENTAGSWQCHCHTGYSLDADGHTCNEINECLMNNGGCDDICVNDPLGNYTCDCFLGYYLGPNGHSCHDIDECLDDIWHECDVLHGNCVNTVGSYVCVCDKGWIWNEISRGCDDVEECAESNGWCQHNCTDREGYFECSCWDGFELYPDRHTCKDVDECEEDLDDCEQICKNKYGYYICKCEDGYELQPNGSSCEDINECDDDNGGCEMICVNEDGGHTCDCGEGYALGVDGRSCDDVNECEDDDVCDQICINNDGSFECDCEEGYELLPNGRDCKDINECALQIDNCEHRCRNIPGSYECSCNPHYRLIDGHKCIREYGYDMRMTFEGTEYQVWMQDRNDPRTQALIELLRSRVNRMITDGILPSHLQFREFRVNAIVEGSVRFLVEFLYDLPVDLSELSHFSWFIGEELTDYVIDTDDVVLVLSTEEFPVHVLLDDEDENTVVVEVDDPCSVYNQIDYCQNGANCIVDPFDRPLCDCPDDFEGLNCADEVDEDLSTTHIALIAVGSFLFLVILLIIICCCVYMARYRNDAPPAYRSAPEPSEFGYGRRWIRAIRRPVYRTWRSPGAAPVSDPYYLPRPRKNYY